MNGETEYLANLIDGRFQQQEGTLASLRQEMQILRRGMQSDNQLIKTKIEHMGETMTGKIEGVGKDLEKHEREDDRRWGINLKMWGGAVTLALATGGWAMAMAITK